MKPVKKTLNHVIDWFPTILELAGIKDSDSVLSFYIYFRNWLSHLYKQAPTDIDGVSLAHTIHNPKMSDEEQKVRDRLIIGVFHHFQKQGFND